MIWTTLPDHVSYTPTEHPQCRTRPRNMRLSDGVHPSKENMGSLDAVRPCGGEPYTPDTPYGKQGLRHEKNRKLLSVAQTLAVRCLPDRTTTVSPMERKRTLEGTCVHTTTVPFGVDCCRSIRIASRRVLVRDTCDRPRSNRDWGERR